MGYPTGVFSPSVRSNGQTIDASHVNDLQTEVTAIETALLGTITHSVNVSGASTLASLQCALSTFASANFTASTQTNEQVTNSTITNLQVTNSTFTNRPVLGPPPAALVFLESTGAVGSSAASTLAFTAQAFLTNSTMHSTGTNPERLIPQSTGLYRVTAQVSFSSVSAGLAVRTVVIRDSTGDNICIAETKSTYAGTLQVVGYKRFDVLGGYALVAFLSDGASTHSLTTGVGRTWFAMEKL